MYNIGYKDTRDLRHTDREVPQKVSNPQGSIFFQYNIHSGVLVLAFAKLWITIKKLSEKKLTRPSGDILRRSRKSMEI